VASTGEANPQLEAERKRLLALFQQAPGFVCYLRGRDFVFELANPAYFQVVGHRDILGKPARQAIPEVEGQQYFELLERVFTTGEPFVGRGMRLLLQREPGAALSEAFVDFVYQPILDAEGLVTGILVQGQDVTELKRQEAERQAMQEALRASEERYRTLFQSIDDGFCLIQIILDAHGQPADYRFLEANEAFERHTGLRNALGRTAREMVPELDASWFRLYGSVALNGEPLRFENHAPAMNRWFEVYANRVGKPELLQVALVFKDITERKAAQLALQESEARFRNMADFAPVMLWVTDSTASCTYLSRSWYDFTGQTEETGLGMGWLSAVHPDDARMSGEIFRAASIKHQPFRLEYRLRRHDGEYRWAIDSASPRFAPGGEFLGYIGSVIDITDRRRAEEERERLFKQERAARAEAEEASRLKDEFLATVSHELRTPLTSMLGWVQMLRTGSLPPDKRARALETVERNARSQAQLIEDLLDVSRILAGKLKLDVETLEVGALVEQALESVRPAAEAKSLRIQTVLDSNGTVMGDSHRLQQVVWNLLSNAVKFTPKGGRVQVLVERRDSSVELTVADTGQGIDPKFLPYVFERFRQAEEGTTRSHGGLGLGLSIVRHLVELHGGTVSAFSAGLGQGASFTVRLPLAVTRRREPSLPPTFRENAFGGDIQCPPELYGLHVLVVDDEADTREMLRALLEGCNARVTAASSATEALAKLDSALPDILLSDIGMPEEDGYFLIRKIRARPPEAGGDIPAVALTAYVRTEDRTRVLLAGFQSHVPKPVEPLELLAVLASLSGRNRQGRA
jgi:PAS domain S-box-containing protein